MAGHFKKRRGPQGPNKNEAKVLRGKIEENRARMTGTLSARFPAVKNLKVHVAFLDPRQQPLEEKKMDLKPSDAAVFVTACPGRCGRGSFDFAKKIAEAIETRLPVSDISVKCLEPLYAGAREVCGWEARCRIEVEYMPVQL